VTDRTTFEGRCHCGNIRFEYTTVAGSRGTQPRRCACDFCTRHNNVYVSDPGGELAVTIGDKGLLSRYTFGHGTAEFLVCKACGVMPVIVSCIDGHDYGVVNCNTLDDMPPASGNMPIADLGGETREERLARRSRNWIGTVRIS